MDSVIYDLHDLSTSDPNNYTYPTTHRICEELSPWTNTIPGEQLAETAAGYWLYVGDEILC